ncbi:MAG: sugar transporter, permease protein [Thermoleophilia bacterium]|nr:sugar transporter, permease protein [Thermoleophilia bacterium]
MTRRFNAETVLVPVLAVIAAMLVGMVLIYAIGYDALFAYGSLVDGAIGGPSAIGATLLRATPIILTGLSVMIAFRAGLFNIGGTGQAIIGLICGGVVAIKFGALPGPLHWMVALTVAAIGGGLWGAIAGFLKVARGANEVVVTIMLNYIAIRFGEYLLGLGGPLQEKGSSVPASAPFEQSAQLPVFWRPDPFTEVHVGVVVALLAAAFAWFLVGRTAIGFQIRAVGLQPDAAEYGGMSVTKVTVIGMFLAGAFAGLGGAVATLGELERLQKSELAVVQIGFAGIAVALLGRNTAIGCVFAGLLLGGLDSGAVGIQNDNALPPGVATKLIGLIQGVIVLFVGADLVFRRLANRITTSVGLSEDGRHA